MKRVWFFLFLFVFSSRTSFALHCQKFEFRDTPFTSCILDLANDRLSLFWKDQDGDIFGSISALEKTLKKQSKRLLFATNGGIFLPGQKPMGIYIENGVLQTPIDLRKGKGNFYLRPNGVFLIQNKMASILESGEFASRYSQKEPRKLAADPRSIATKPPQEEFHFAVQSGPLLVYHGKLHPAFTQGSKNKKFRSGVGVSKEGKVVFVISDRPVNFYDFAELFRDSLGCKEALYLDGTISKLYAPDFGRNEKGGNFATIFGVVETKNKASD